MFTTAFKGQYSHEKCFRVFVHFQKQDVLFCETYAVKEHSPESQREAMWFHVGA